MLLLSPELIGQIRETAERRRLVDKRSVLLAPIDPRYKDGLEIANTPGDQLVLDLWAMNQTVSAIGGEMPLKLWLIQAAATVSAFPDDKAFFLECAEKVRELPLEPDIKATIKAEEAMAALKDLAKTNPEIARAVQNARQELETIIYELKPVGVHKLLHDELQKYQIGSLPIVTDALHSNWTEVKFVKRTLIDTLDMFPPLLGKARSELEKLTPDSRDRTDPENWLSSLARRHITLNEIINKGDKTEATFRALKDFRDEICRRMSQLNLIMSHRADDLRINRLVDQLRSFASNCLTLDDQRAIKLRATASQLAALEAEIGQLLARHDHWQKFDDDLGSVEGNFIYDGISEYGLKTFSDEWPRVVQRISELASEGPGEWVTTARKHEQSFAESCPLPITPPIAEAAQEQFRAFVKTVRTEFLSVDQALVGCCNRLSVVTRPIEDLAKS